MLRDFYTDIFGSDFINTETFDSKESLMYCVTGLRNANWELRVVSFYYGFLKSRALADMGSYPMYLIEVARQLYVVIEDCKENEIYLWQMSHTDIWKELEPQTKC